MPWTYPCLSADHLHSLLRSAGPAPRAPVDPLLEHQTVGFEADHSKRTPIDRVRKQQSHMSLLHRHESSPLTLTPVLPVEVLELCENHLGLDTYLRNAFAFQCQVVHEHGWEVHCRSSLVWGKSHKIDPTFLNTVFLPNGFLQSNPGKVPVICDGPACASQEIELPDPS